MARMSGRAMRQDGQQTTQGAQGAQGGQGMQGGQGGQQSGLKLVPQQFSMDINSPYWLGGVNVHNTITIVLLVLLVVKAKAYKL